MIDPPGEPVNGSDTPVSIVGERLRGIATRTGDAELADLVCEVVAIEDRLTYAECALHHLRDDLDKLIALTALEAQSPEVPR
jgi:hypothetical protein